MAIKVMKVGKKAEESPIVEETIVESASVEQEETVNTPTNSLKIKCPYCGSGLTITRDTTSCSECDEEISSDLVNSLFNRSEELAANRLEEAKLAKQKLGETKGSIEFMDSDNTDFFKKKDAFSGNKAKKLVIGNSKSPNKDTVKSTKSSNKSGLVIPVRKSTKSNNIGVTIKSNAGNTGNKGKNSVSKKSGTPWLAIVIGGFILVVVGGLVIGYFLIASQFTSILKTVGESTYEDSYGDTYGGTNTYTGDGSYIQDVPFETFVEDYYVPTESEKEDLKNALVSNATTYSFCEVNPLLDPMNPGVIYFNIDSSSGLGQRITKVLAETDPLTRESIDPNLTYDISTIVSVTNNKLEVPFDVLYMFILDEDPSSVLYSNYGGYDVINVLAE